jgi:hypothetical protein
MEDAKKGRGSGHFGKKRKVGMRTKTKTPWRTHAWNEKQNQWPLWKKNKSGPRNKNQNPGERMHEMKTKPKQHL